MTDTTPIILLTAMRDEMQPTLQKLGLTLDGPGKVREKPVVAAVSGIGAQRIERRLEQLLDQYSPARVILFGAAGALDPELEVGQLLRPGRLVTDDEPPIVLVAGDADTTLYTAPRLISTVEDKADALRKHDACAADMESYHAARVLKRRDVPLTVIRAVCDTADVALPAQSERWVNDAGQPDAAAAAIYLAVHPWAAPSLLRLRDALHHAAANLADAVDHAIGE